MHQDQVNGHSTTAGADIDGNGNADAPRAEQTDAARLAAELRPVLGTLYSDTELDRLARLLVKLDVDNPRAGGTKPTTQILAEMLRIQGFDDATAALMARVIPSIDWSRIVTGTRQAARILGISRITLIRQREAGRLPIHSQTHGETATSSTSYRISDVLFAREWRRRTPYSGGPVPYFPDAAAF